MKCSLGIYNFLEEISRLSHSIVFLYFFALITEEGFFISPCCSLELCIQMGIFFPFPLCLSSLLFSAICKASSDNHFAFLHFFFFSENITVNDLSLIIKALLHIKRVSLVAQTVKNLPTVRETQVQSLNWEDPLEKGMATHSSILA